jgi:hypothetical protein
MHSNQRKTVMSKEIKTAIRATLDALKAQVAKGKFPADERRLTEAAIKAAEKAVGGRDEAPRTRSTT